MWAILSLTLTCWTRYTGKTAADQAAEEVDRYGKYSDENVLQAWASVVPPHRVLQLKTPKAIVDVMLGAPLQCLPHSPLRSKQVLQRNICGTTGVLAISRGGLTDSAYIKDLKVRGQDEVRIECLTINLRQCSEKQLPAATGATGRSVWYFKKLDRWRGSFLAGGRTTTRRR